jgi:hypothetical protein
VFYVNKTQLPCSARNNFGGWPKHLATKLPMTNLRHYMAGQRFCVQTVSDPAQDHLNGKLMIKPMQVVTALSSLAQALCVSTSNWPLGHNAWAIALSSTSKFVGFAVVG